MPQTLLGLPNELLFAIIDYLPIHDLGSLRLTSRDLSSVTTPLIHQKLFGDGDGRAPVLHWAAYRGHGELVKLALSRGISIEMRDGTQKTAIHCAARYKDSSMVHLLLENGAEIDSKDNKGRTALFKAVSWGLARTAKVLVEYGADVDVEDIYGNTALRLTESMTGVVNRAKMKRKLLGYLPSLSWTASFGREGSVLRVTSARPKLYRSEILRVAATLLRR